MILGTAKEEIERSDSLWRDQEYTGLRNQMETDFGIWGPDEFTMPESQGQWENQTTNSGKILANRVIGLGAMASRRLYIDMESIDEGNKAERERLSRTEQLANGMLWMGDRKAIKVPSGRALQSVLFSHAVLRGGNVVSVYWFDGDDGPESDIRVYDPFTVQWLEGEGELEWFCHRRSVRKETLERLLSKTKKAIDIKKEATGGYRLYTFWDAKSWKVAYKGEYIDEFDHDLGYLPVFIHPCGAVPQLASDTYSNNTLKWSWQSVFMNTRDVYPLESKLLSIEKTKAIDSGRKDIIAVYDSNNGQPPADMRKLQEGPGQRNSIIYLDAAHGQDFRGFVEHPDNRVVDQFMARVRSEMDIMATMDPIMSGSVTRMVGSGAQVAELRNAAMEFTNPFKKCVEETLVWVAEENISQFKGGKFGKLEVEGRDSKKKKFSIELKPTDVVEAHFECELIFDNLRNELTELGAAVQKINSGLTSRRTARVQHNIVDDPDREQDIMDEEVASNDPILRFQKIAKYWKDQGEEQLALAYEAMSRIAAEEFIKQAMQMSLMPSGAEGLMPSAGLGNGEMQSPLGVLMPETAGLMRNAPSTQLRTGQGEPFGSAQGKQGAVRP